MSKPSKPWIRLYRSTITNRKVQSLGLELMGFWLNLLCISDDDGNLGTIDDIIWKMKGGVTVDVTSLRRHCDVLCDVTLVSQDKRGVFRLHDWDEYQQPSDTSAERTRKYREKQRVSTPVTSHGRHGDGDGDVTVTVQSQSQTRKKSQTLDSDSTKSATPTSNAGVLLLDKFAASLSVKTEALLKKVSWLQFASVFNGWVSDGADPDLDVWPTIVSVSKQKPGFIPDSPIYYSKMIAAAASGRATIQTLEVDKKKARTVIIPGTRIGSVTPTHAQTRIDMFEDGEWSLACGMPPGHPDFAWPEPYRQRLIDVSRRLKRYRVLAEDGTYTDVPPDLLKSILKAIAENREKEESHA